MRASLEVECQWDRDQEQKFMYIGESFQDLSWIQDFEADFL